MAAPPPAKRQRRVVVLSSDDEDVGAGEMVCLLDLRLFCFAFIFQM